jgi:hypothetical protein
LEQVTNKKEIELRFRWKRLLNYGSVVKQMPFFLFLAGLAVIYIYNGHLADKLNRDIAKTERELKELEYEYKTVKGQVLFQSKQSELVKAVVPLGLKEMSVQPVILVDSTESKKSKFKSRFAASCFDF